MQVQLLGVAVFCSVGQDWWRTAAQWELNRDACTWPRQGAPAPQHQCLQLKRSGASRLEVARTACPVHPVLFWGSSLFVPLLRGFVVEALDSFTWRLTPPSLLPISAPADMHKDGGSWHYNFLYLDVEAPVPQQVRTARPVCAVPAGGS